MKDKPYRLVIFLALFVCACAGFRWKYYSLDCGDCQAGKLRAHDPKDDLPLSVCKDDEQDRGKCLVFLRAELEAMKAEREDLIQRLQACEGMQGQ